MGSVASCKKLTPAGEMAEHHQVLVHHLSPGAAAKTTTEHHHHRARKLSSHRQHSTGKSYCISQGLEGIGSEVGAKRNSLPRSLKNHCNGTGSTQLEEAAALKLKLLLQQLDKGQVPHINELRKTVHLASEALSWGQGEEDAVRSEEEKLESIGDRQVREWLSTTFTRTDSFYEAHFVPMTPIVKFKAAANTIIISQYFGSMRRDSLPNSLQYTPALTQHLQQVDSWEFDMFAMERVSDGQPLRYIGHQLLKTHNLFEKCGISVSRFDAFLVKIEEGYNRYGNPYHNAIHGADVAQTLHSMLLATGLKEVMSDLEVLAALLAALIHDVDHPGTTNNFQINQGSEYALLYNDRAVLENHHLYYAFSLLKENHCNFLSGLGTDDYKMVRGLMVDMVLATDMSTHFDQLKHMRHVMSQPEAGSTLQDAERSKVFSMLLHLCDISHPGKPWSLHREWSFRLAEEFYRQGDLEKKQSLPVSPLCDRNHGNLPTSQIGFMDYIVTPAFELCADVLELLLSTPPVSPALTDSTDTPSPPPTASTPPSATPTPALPTSAGEESTVDKPRVILPRDVWEQHLKLNRVRWGQQQSKEEGEATPSTGSTEGGEVTPSTEEGEVSTLSTESTEGGGVTPISMDTGGTSTGLYRMAMANGGPGHRMKHCSPSSSMDASSEGSSSPDTPTSHTNTIIFNGTTMPCQT